jgi:hypothetical protein
MALPSIILWQNVEVGISGYEGWGNILLLHKKQLKVASDKFIIVLPVWWRIVP